MLLPSGSLPSGHPRVIAFDLDYDTLHIGTFLGSGGRIYSVALDGTYTPVAPPVVFATGVGSGAFHDAMGVDACGNLYVSDYSSSSLYRIGPSGAVRSIWTGGVLSSEFPHGLEWGTGRDGWRADAIYVPQPYDDNHVSEFILGVPVRP